MNHILRNRIKWAIAVAAFLGGFVFVMLWLADTYDSDPKTYCSPSLWLWQWLGCVMAAREDLAAGLIGFAGVLFAGWLAFTAVQEQIDQEQTLRREAEAKESEERVRDERDAKDVAIFALSRIVANAGAAFVLLDKAVSAGDPISQKGTVENFRKGEGIVGAMEDALKSTLLLEISKELNVKDRIRYLAIIEGLANFASSCRWGNEAPGTTNAERLRDWRGILLNVSDFLAAFDERPARVFNAFVASRRRPE